METYLLLLLLGILLVVWSITEALWTTIWVEGDSGPLTSRLTTYTWRLFRRLFGRRHHALSLGGPFILSLSILLWILLLWLGWLLVFASDPTAIVSASSKAPPDWTDYIWYVGYNLITVGNGDFTPQGDGWQVVSALIGLSGMIMITLSVTYILQIISAVVNKRAFASQVICVGKSAEEFVLNFWNGSEYRLLELQLNSFSQQLATLTEQHLAFPILHYYHAKDSNKAPAIAIAILHDAILLLEHGVRQEHRPPPAFLSAARKSVDNFLKTLKSAFIEQAEDLPPRPGLTRLREQGVPTVEDRQFTRKLEENEDKRRLVLGLVRSNGRDWPG